MTLSIYVGTLTGYFGPAIRASGEFDPPPSDDAVRERVLEWRTWVGEGLQSRGHILESLDWDESATGDGSETPLEVDDLRALKLVLAYTGQSNVLPPVELPAEPDHDPRWVELAANGFADHEYPHLLVPEFWLPGEFDFTFPCPYPDGHETETGSLGRLTAEIADACPRVFDATTADCAAWLITAQGTDLDDRARRAFATLCAAAHDAHGRGVPMLLHA